jgi:hypothetical protein
MIWLARDCMMFQLATGESIPFSAEMISVELMGDAADKFDPEVIQHAAASVFHYFRYELKREIVTVGEFSEALEKVLRGLGFDVRPADGRLPEKTADLRALACESGDARELVFFPRLRDELRTQLQAPRRVVRFRGLRGCVKHLTGAQRWGPRCENLQEQIVSYLRECLTAEAGQGECGLVVE